MITITKSMVALSALIAAGLVGVFDPTAPRAEDPSASVVVAQRSPMSSEMFTPVSMAYFVSQRFIEQQQLAQQEQQPQQVDGGKSNKLDCSHEGWPYMSRNCLVASDGSEVRQVTRVITVERRVSDNESELMRMPADLAQR
jgi:hypothetical protein